MRKQRFIHIYKKHKGQKRPVITVALNLDLSGDDISGIGMGFSYCSEDDHPSKKTGRMIASSRANKAIESHNALAEKNPAYQRLMTGRGTQYKNKKYMMNENAEPVKEGHTHYLYFPASLDKLDFDSVKMPEKEEVVSRIILALSNIKKFNQL